MLLWIAMSSDAEATPRLANGLRIQIAQPAQVLDPAQLRWFKEMERRLEGKLSQWTMDQAQLWHLKGKEWVWARRHPEAFDQKVQLSSLKVGEPCHGAGLVEGAIHEARTHAHSSSVCINYT